MLLARRAGKFEDAHKALGKALQQCGLSSTDLATLVRGVPHDAAPAAARPNGDSAAADSAASDSAAADVDMAPASSASPPPPSSAPSASDHTASSSSSSSPVVGPEIPVPSVTILFNLALVYEKQLRLPEAVALYRAIVSQHPRYTAACFRLGNLERDCGEFRGARYWYKRALEVDKHSAEAHTLLANLYCSRGDYDNASKWFKRLLGLHKGDEENEDVYGKLGLANLFEIGKHDFAATGAPADAKRQEAKLRALRHRAKEYRAVLAREPSNLFAANGLAICLAEQGYVREAKEAFALVREASTEVPDIGVNLAHVLVAHEQYENAIKLYQHVMARNPHHPDPRLLLYLARAHYLQGDSLRAKSVLLRALHIAPGDLVLQYNLALIQEDYGIGVLQKARSDRTYREVAFAVKELKLAAATFARLAASTHKKDHHAETLAALAPSATSSSTTSFISTTTSSSSTADVASSSSSTYLGPCEMARDHRNTDDHTSLCNAQRKRTKLYRFILGFLGFTSKSFLLWGCLVC